MCYRDAQRWQPPPDPLVLVLDLDGDGIETVGITANPVLFDHDADGTRTGTGWIKPDDGLLVLDLNGNGTIDSGRELFGDQTLKPVDPAPIPGASTDLRTTHRDGYAALAAHDVNRDGQINSQDAIYTQLRVWQDANQDGISQSTELRTLSELGIAGIGVGGTAANTNLGNGNTMPLQGSFTRTDGSTGLAELSGSLLLAGNGFYREFTDDPVVTQAAAALPQMGGSGWVRDLREAMSTGGASAAALQSSVSAFAAATTRDGQMAVIDAMLADWAGTSGRMLQGLGSYEMVLNFATETYVAQDIDPSGLDSPGRLFVYAKPEGLYEIFDTVTGAVVQPGGTGTSTGSAGASLSGGGGSSGGGAAMANTTSWRLTSEGQTFFRHLNVLEAFNGSRFFEMPLNGSLSGSGGGMASSGGGGGGGGGGAAMTSRNVGVTLTAAQVALLQDSYAELRNSVYAALVVQTRLQGYIDKVSLVIDEAGIRFDTSGLAAKLDQSKAADARNALIDLVELNRYAQGTLQAVGFDGIARLRQDIAALPAGSPLLAELQSLNLFQSGTKGSAEADIYLGDAADNNFSGGAGSDVMDGGAGNDSLQGEVGDDSLSGGLGDDSLSGEAGNDTLNAGEGDDALYGGNGSDTLLGGTGSDRLYAVSTYGGGTAGDVDTLDGGAGNDYLFGGFGSQTYLFGRGDGQDTISNYADAWNGYADPTVGKQDVLKFKAGVLASDVLVTRSGDNLVIKINGTSDQVTVSGYFGGDGKTTNTLDAIRFEDGTSWSYAQVVALSLKGTDGNDVLTGTSAADVIDGGAGNDTLNGGAGNDTYTFGLGAGADTISDYDTAASNTDVLLVGAGVAADQLWFRKVGSSLEVSVIGTSDKSVISSWYSGAAYHVEQFKTADGKVLTDTKVQALVDAMAAFSPPAAGQTTLSGSYQTALAPVIAANWQ